MMVWYRRIVAVAIGRLVDGAESVRETRVMPGTEKPGQAQEVGEGHA